MATNDRSRQQSAEAPQSGVQQGAWQSGQQSGQQGSASQSMPARGGGRGMPAPRGGYEPAYLGGNGGPFSLMRRISDEMDRLFESFGMGGPLTRGLGRFGAFEGEGALQSLWSPRIEVCERDGRLVIQADLPGVRKEDVNVRIDDDRVVIQGERRQETRREEQGYFHTERTYGSFYREIPLPEGVDADQAKATFHDGVLEIELPAPSQQQRGRALTIEDSSSGGGQQAQSRPSGEKSGTSGQATG